MTPSEKLLFFPKLCQTEIPYVVVKFAVFGVAEDLLVQALVGQDDLLISALSGSIAGVAGALASNPADYVFTPELKGSIGEGPNHSNHSNHSNSFKIGIFRNFSLENSKISENFNIF